MTTRTRLRARLGTRAVAAASAVVAATALAACGTSQGAEGSSSPSDSGSAAPVSTLRLGFFPNLTHAPAYVAIQQGYLKDSLGALDVKVAPTLFNAGPEAVNALFAGSVDIAYVGPNPTVQAWTQSKGAAVKVIAGSSSGGASLVVAKDVTAAAGLKGTTVASPQLGNTQDVALKYWLEQQGFQESSDGSGDVTVTNMANSDIVTAFQSGQLAGAWVPEPYAQQLVAEGGHVLVDERTLWPGGRFVTSDVVVRTQFLDEHPDLVDAFLTAHVQALQLIRKDPAQAQADFNSGLQALTGSSVDPTLLASAWKQLSFTADPLKATLVVSAQHAVDTGLLDQSDIDGAGGFDGLYDLAPLDKALVAAGLARVAS